MKKKIKKKNPPLKVALGKLGILKDKKQPKWGRKKNRKNKKK